jgi:hypothetical protein
MSHPTDVLQNSRTCTKNSKIDNNFCRTCTRIPELESWVLAEIHQFLLKTLVNLLLHPCPLLFLHVLRNDTLGYSRITYKPTILQQNLIKKNPNHFRCAVLAIRPREEADSAFEFDVALDLHRHLHPREIELGHAARFRRRLQSVCRREAAAPLADELPDDRHVYGQPLRALERDLAV